MALRIFCTAIVFCRSYEVWFSCYYQAFLEKSLAKKFQRGWKFGLRFTRCPRSENSASQGEKHLNTLCVA